MPRKRTQLVRDGISGAPKHIGVERVLTNNGKVFTGKYPLAPGGRGHTARPAKGRRDSRYEH